MTLNEIAEYLAAELASVVKPLEPIQDAPIPVPEGYFWRETHCKPEHIEQAIQVFVADARPRRFRNFYRLPGNRLHVQGPAMVVADHGRVSVRVTWIHHPNEQILLDYMAQS